MLLFGAQHLQMRLFIDVFGVRNEGSGDSPARRSAKSPDKSKCSVVRHQLKRCCTRLAALALVKLT
jgi:hypothetical protein